MVGTATGVLLLIGFLFLVGAAFKKCPWWLSLFILYVIELLRLLPVGR